MISNYGIYCPLMAAGPYLFLQQKKTTPRLFAETMRPIKNNKQK